MRGLILGGIILLGIAAPVMAEELEFMVNNKSSSDVNEIYASPVSKDDWGDDILGKDEVLKAGEFGKATIKSAKGQCKFDLKFVFEEDGDKDEDNDEVIEKDIDLCETGSYTLEDE